MGAEQSRTHQDTIEIVREIVYTSWPGRFESGDIRDDASLGSDGLGLDSVEITEVLFACEERCGVGATDELFSVVPLTIERVADHFAPA
jgi:acyl carrier protein